MNAGSFARHSLLLALALSFAGALPACRKKEIKAESTAAAPPPPAPPPAPPPKPDVQFAGTYQRYATTAFRAGRRISVANNRGTGSMTIGNGKAVYTQSYPFQGKNKVVTQHYKYNEADARPVAGGFDLPLVFEKMDSNDTSYAPDKNNVKIEARKQASGWQIGFLATDNNQVMGGVEFK